MSTTIDTTTLDTFVGQMVLEAGVADKLRSGAIVADLDCGDGLSTILMAQAFPRSAFSGYDADADSVGAARERARQAIAGTPSGRNVRFAVSDAADIPAYAYDLVTSFGGLDGEDAAAAARRVRRAIAPDGTWVIADREEAGPERLTAILADAGFTRVRVVSESPFDVVLEARP